MTYLPDRTSQVSQNLIFKIISLNINNLRFRFQKKTTDVSINLRLTRYYI